MLNQKTVSEWPVVNGIFSQSPETVFPNLFVCWHSKRAKQILRYHSHMNLFILIASIITDDSKKGDNLFFGDHHFFGQYNTIFDVIDLYFMATFTQFWLRTCKSIQYF